MKKKHILYILYIVLAAALCLAVCLAFRNTGRAPEPVSLNVSLYPVLPDYASFEETVAACWRERHPEVALHFVSWDCYDAEVPEDLDVFVFDTINLDTFAEKGCLLALSEEEIRDFDGLIPGVMDGCRVDGTICAVPQFLCADLLYTRKGDAELKDVRSIDGLRDALGESGLLTDEAGDDSRICLYLQALIDEKQVYMDQYPPLEEGQLSAKAVRALELMRDMRQAEPEGGQEDGGWFPCARQFAGGVGRAYIGYSEAMDVMGESASEMDFRLFSMTEGENIPVFYVDAAAVNARVSGEKRGLALELLNMITGTDLLVRASARDGDPRYLLTARTGVYDALASDYPIYAELKTIASVPGARVFRIRPDGAAYLAEAEKNVEALPSLAG